MTSDATPAAVADDDVEPTARRWPTVARTELRAFAELLALTGFAVTQPLLDIFGRAPDQFIFRGATDGDIVAFALVLLLLAPMVAWVIEAAVGLVDHRARRVVHVAFIAIALAAIAMQVLRSSTSGPLLVAAALAVGALGAFTYLRAEPVRLWLSFVAVAPPVFCALFLFGSQTSQLMSDPAGVDQARVRRPAPVVMIVFDELPLASLIDSDGTIDADLYPNFATLADQSHWFRNTTSVSNFTWNAAPALLTGQDPQDDMVPTAASHPESIFTLLGPSMPIEASESVTTLCPVDLCERIVPPDGGLRGLLGDAARILRARLSPRPIDANPADGLVEAGGRDAPGSDQRERDVAAVSSSQRAAEFVDAIEDQSATLHYLHIILPHKPFRYLPDGSQYPLPDPELGLTGETWSSTDWLVELSRQRHLMQSQRADALLGRTMAKMREVGMYDDALIAVTADHGISFQPGENVRGLDLDVPMTDSVASEVMWVPFFLKEPGQTDGEVNDANVLTTDVMPTIADVLKTDIPWKVDGRSALDPPRRTRTKGMHLSEVVSGQILAGEVYDLDERAGWNLLLGHSVDRIVPTGAGADGATGADRLFRVGPRPDLVDRPLGDAGSLTPVPVELEPASDPSDVDPASGTVPALVRGSIDGVPAGTPLAVVVNGTIRATAPAYADGADVEVAAVVPASSFTKGANQVQIYQITS